MSAPLPFYLITHRCGDGVYTDEARTDAPLDWLAFVDLFWRGNYVDVVSVLKIVPPSSDAIRGYVEDITRNLALELSQRSFLWQKEPCPEVIAFLKERKGDWYVEETENDAMVGAFFGVHRRVA